MKLNFCYHLHCSKQCITFARKNPTFACIISLHLRLFFQGKIQVNSDENNEITYDFSIFFFFQFYTMNNGYKVVLHPFR
jgi:hypothetical protein